MRLYEAEVKRIFKEFVIPVPKGYVVKSPKEVHLAVKETGLPVAVKAQLLFGSRQKAGGIRFASNLDETAAETRNLLNRRIGGYEVGSVLIEEKVIGNHEYYLGVTIDQVSGKPMVLFSTQGGIDVETVAEREPEKLASQRIHISRGFFLFEARNLCKSMGLEGPILMRVSDILHKLYAVFMRFEGLIAEINPLLITSDSELYAVDGVLEIDDNALFRHTEVELNLNKRFRDTLEMEAFERGLSYVKFDGDIGVVGSGAGLTMATIDIIKTYGGRPANFLETGGGITEDLMERAVEFLLMDKRLRALFINLYGGINPLPLAARGITKAIKKLKPEMPVLIKLVGNQQEEAWKILEEIEIPIVKNVKTEDAVEKLMEILSG